VPRGVHCSLGILGGLDEWDHDARSPEVEGPSDPTQIDRLHPDQTGNAVVGEEGEQRGVETSQVDAVLGVDHNEVRAYRSGGVDDAGVTGDAPETVDDLFASECVGTRHGGER
jgi:hypothetical protein